ncbi:MAG: hypothetical protein KAR15_08610, partial [Desulfobacterales bacterium]|nr:hypothetical protein [Desulfobacterales bacterium]
FYLAASTPESESTTRLAGYLRVNPPTKQGVLIGLSKPGAKHPVPPATIGALRAPVFSRRWR